MVDALSEKVSLLQSSCCFVEEELEEPIHVLDVGLGTVTGSDPVLNTCLNEDDLDASLALVDNLRNGVRVYCVDQCRSFEPLNVTANGFKRLIERHNIMHQFCDLITCFRKTTERTEYAYCGPMLKNITATKFEIAYVFKYPELRASGSEPWTLRQTAVYQQYDFSRNQSTWILLNPRPDSVAWIQLQKTLRRPTQVSVTLQGQLRIHDVLLSSYVDNWKPYILHYDERLSSIVRTVLGTKVEQRTELNHDTLGRIRFIESRCLPLRSIFSSYSRALKELKAIVSDSSEQTRSPNDKHTWVDNHEQRAAAYRDSVDALVAQSNLAAQLLRDRLSYKDQSAMMDDSATVRVITVITLAYLSFTVVATIMELPFFHLEAESRRLQLAPQFWIYLAVSVPLTLATVGYWRLTLWIKARRRKQRNLLARETMV